MFLLIVPNPPWHLLVRAFIPKATTSQETNTLFVIGNAATLITDVGLKGQFCGWLDRARFWHLILQNSYLSLRGIPDGIVGSLTYRIVDERQGANNRQFHDRDLYVFCFNMSDGKVT